MLPTFLELFQDQLQVGQGGGILLALLLQTGHLHVGRITLRSDAVQLLLQTLNLLCCLLTETHTQTHAIVKLNA